MKYQLYSSTALASETKWLFAGGVPVPFGRSELKILDRWCIGHADREDRVRVSRWCCPRD